MDLNDKVWRPFYLTDIFTFIKLGKELCRSEYIEYIEYGMPVVTRSAKNNGISGFLANKENVTISERCLTLSAGGNIGSAFYQPFRFIYNKGIYALSNPKFTKYTYLFLSTLIVKIGYKYSFYREINYYRLCREKIILPVNEKDEPDYEYMDKYCKLRMKEMKDLYRVKNYFQENDKSLENIKWRPFMISDIFIIKSGVAITKAMMRNGDIPVISASKENNGISAWIVADTTESKNVLSVNSNGSVGETFYHP